METNALGNTVERTRLQGDRYTFYESLDKNWQPFDTAQDAFYFGVWVNKATRQILTFAESDVIRVTCPTVESFNKEIEALCAFHAPGRIATAFRPEATSIFRQDRTEFLIAA